MFEHDRRKCTAQATGIIVDVKEVGLETASWRVTVEYQVDGQTFSVWEWAKLVSETIKLGPFPIGQKKRPSMPGMVKGNPAVVCYNPADPSMAYLRDNRGWTVE